jgi:tRNA (cmo5U34)-methyltransferase
LSPQFHKNPNTYLDRIREAFPRYDELQAEAVKAIPSAPERVLDLGMGTGQTANTLLETYPDAWIIGLDASPDMVFRARQDYDGVQLARMEDPLPDGPWDLVISVLSTHHLTSDQKKDLFRRVREESKALVLGYQVKADKQTLPPEEGVDYLETAEDLAEWCGGEVAWTADDLAVVRATYGS